MYSSTDKVPREAHKAIKWSPVVEFSFATVTSSGLIGGDNSQLHRALDSSSKADARYAIPVAMVVADGSSSSTMHAGL
jgi:hypothetical protein